MKREDQLNKLREDEHYYGEFGKQFLSNSDISTLLTNPLSLGKSMSPIPAFLVGGYFHTAILEPDKLKKFKIIEASTRNTKLYKEISYHVPEGSIDYIGYRDRDGHVHGDFVKYFKNGNTELEGQLIKGYYDGDWQYYNEEGELTKEITWDMGTEVDSIIY